MRNLLATAILVLGLTATAQADSHRRVVILRFDGPGALADEARELVMDAAGHDNDVVALGRWADAHKAAGRKLRGAKAWAKSAREAQVDAIIEGAVRRGRRGYQLELVVREAATGNQVDSVELQVDDDRKAERMIEGELTDLLAWVEPPPERRDLLRLDRGRDRDDRAGRDRADDRAGRDRADDRTAGRDDDRRTTRDDDRRTTRDDDRRATRDDDRRTTRDDDRRATRDDERRAGRDDDRRATRDDRDGDRRTKRDHRDDDRPTKRNDRNDDRTATRDRGDRDDRDRDDDRDDRDDDRDDRDDDRDGRGSDGFGFAADRADTDDGRDLADETVALLDGENPRGSRSKGSAGGRAPMLRIAGGGYVSSRSLGFTAAGGGDLPGADGGHPTMGLRLGAEVFPFGETGAGRRLTGLGLRFDVGHALGNKVEVQGGQRGVDQTSWSGSVAYRRPLDPVTVQLDVGYGHTSQTIVDKPASVDIVDASYGFVRGGARVELPIAGRATIGAGAHYLYLTSAPEMQKLGAPAAMGLDADASVEVPLTRNLTAMAAVDYQRFSLSFSGPAAASAATDTFLSGRLTLAFSY